MNCCYSGRVFSAFGALVAFFGVGFVTEVVGDPLTYDASGDTVTISDCEESASGDLIIPSTYEGKPVTSIGRAAFSGCSNLTSVMIGDSVTSIEEKAFYNCSSLTRIVFGGNAPSLSTNVFTGVSDNAQIFIKSFASGFGEMFGGLPVFKPVTLTVASRDPDFGVTVTVSPEDWNGQMGGTTQFTRVYSKGTEVTLSAKQIVGVNQFKQWLKNGEPVGTGPTMTVTMDYDRTLRAVYEPQHPTLTVASRDPDSGVTVTVSPADRNGQMGGTTQFTRVYSKGTEVTLSAKQSVGAKQFKQWLKNGEPAGTNPTVTVTMDYDLTLRAVYIPQPVTLTVASRDPDSGVTVTVSPADRNGQMGGTTQFTRVYSKGTEVTLNAKQSVGAKQFKQWLKNGVYATSNPKVIVTMDYDRTLRAVYEPTLKYIVSGNTVTITDCTETASGALVIPSSYNGKPVTAIGNYAFYNCRSLTSVTIPDSVTSIGANAFRDCSGLTSVKIGNSVTSIGGRAFLQCSSLTSIEVGKGSTEYTSEDGVLFNKNKTQLIQFPAGKSGHYTIPDSLTSIRSRNFLHCSSLTSVTIPDSVTSIGNQAFYNCSSLTSVTIPDSVTSIGNQAFYNCSSLTSVTIPNSVTRIESMTFSGCSSLESVTIPGSVTYIHNSAFWACSSLTSVTIPDSVETIREWAFLQCSSLRNITFEGNAPFLGTGAFFGVSEDAKIIVNSGAVGFGENYFGLPVEILENLIIITSSRMDSTGNFIITMQGNTEGIRVMHSSNLKSEFKEVPTTTKQGDNELVVPSTAPEMQGSQGFFRVKAE